MQGHVLILQAPTRDRVPWGDPRLCPLETSGPGCPLAPVLPNPGEASQLIVMGSVATQ